MRIEFYLFLQFIELLRHGLLLTDGPDQPYQEISRSIHIILEILSSNRVLQVEEVPRMIDVDIIAQFHISIGPVLDPKHLVTIVIVDLHQHVIDIPVATPEQSKTVTIVCYDVEA